MTELLKLYSIRHKPTGLWMGSESMLDAKPDQRFLYATRKAAEAKIRRQARYAAGFAGKEYAALAKTWTQCEAVELHLNFPEDDGEGYFGWR